MFLINIFAIVSFAASLGFVMLWYLETKNDSEKGIMCLKIAKWGILATSFFTLLIWLNSLFAIFYS